MGILYDGGRKMKCWECGAEATTTRIEYERTLYSPDTGAWVRGEVKPSKYHRCYCEQCMKRIKEQEQSENAEYIRLKKRRMFLKSCEILESQHTDMYDYREAIDVVEEHITEHPDKYDSAYEALTAIVLVHERINTKMQQKVGRYQVDFVLPNLFVILEIDGDRHKHRKSYDNKRDNAIKAAVGEPWEIIRINTEYLDQNAKALPKAIKEVIKHRKKNPY